MNYQINFLSRHKIMVIVFICLGLLFCNFKTQAQEAMPAEYVISAGESVGFSTSETSYTAFTISNSGPDFMAEVELLWTDTNNNPRNVALSVSGINQPHKGIYSYGFDGAQVTVANKSARSTITVSTSFDYNS